MATSRADWQFPPCESRSGKTTWHALRGTPPVPAARVPVARAMVQLVDHDRLERGRWIREEAAVALHACVRRPANVTAPGTPADPAAASDHAHSRPRRARRPDPRPGTSAGRAR